MEEIFCEKNGVYVSLEEGCKSPGGYCKFRRSCLINYFVKENEKDTTKEKEDNKKTHENTSDK